MFFVCLSFNVAFILNGKRMPHLTRDIGWLLILWSFNLMMMITGKKDKVLICP